MRTYATWLAAATLGLLGACGGGGDTGSQGAIETEIVVSEEGGEGTAPQGDVDIGSKDLPARYVVFSSAASNLVKDDDNGATDVFVHDRLTGLTTRVSVGSAGEEANGLSHEPSISADGRLVAFESFASNLASDDMDTNSDVFLHDRKTGQTTCLTPGIGTGYDVAISANGDHVTFIMGGPAIHVYDCQTGKTIVENVDLPGYYTFYRPSISSEGRYVAFEALPYSNVAKEYTKGQRQVFVLDRLLGVTSPASLNAGGEFGSGASSNASISGDGQTVAFESKASDLVPNDQNGPVSDAFVRDLASETTSRVSTTLGLDPSISADGRFVAFVDGGMIRLHDRQTGVTSGVFTGEVTVDSLALMASGSRPSISPNGSFIVFDSNASYQVPTGEDMNVWSDVLLHDVIGGTTMRLSKSSDGSETDGHSTNAKISG